MKLSVRNMILVAVALLVAACKPAPSAKFDETLTVESAGGRITVPVEANFAWNPSCDARWIKIVSVTATQMDLNVDKNNSFDARTAEITISGDGYVGKMVVTQNQKDIVRLKEGDNVKIGYEAQDVSISLEGNLKYNYEITEGAEWLHLAGTKGLVASTIALTSDKNEGHTTRTAVVSIKAVEGKYSTAVNVIQEGAPQSLTFTHSLSSFIIPTLFGFDMAGLIHWGDGQQAAYKPNLAHSYSSDGEHTVTIQCNGVMTMSFSNLVGLEYIDLTEL